MTDKIVDFVKNDRVIKRHISGHWVSGSSTIVYPIAIWKTRDEYDNIVIQVHGRENYFRGFFDRLSDFINEQIKWDAFYSQHDGSCPSTISIRIYNN